MAKSKKKEAPKREILENGNLKVYSYSPITGEYVSEDEAQPSPLEPGVFLIPAHATEIAPPQKKDKHFRKFDGNEWTYELIPEFVEKVKTKDELAAEARHQRTMMLFASDWRMLPDVPGMHTNGWVEYRQALRDVPQQKGFPEKIIWPQEPKN